MSDDGTPGANLNPVNAAEYRLLEEAGSGNVIQLGETVPTYDADRDAVELRADFLRCLITAGECDIDLRGLRIEGARITGSLDLSGSDIKRRLRFLKCYFEENIVLNDTTMPSLSFAGSHCNGIAAFRLEVKGSLFLGNGFKSFAPITLIDAQIRDRFVCDKAEFWNTPLKADGIDEDDVLPPALDLGHAQIGGFAVAGFTGLAKR